MARPLAALLGLVAAAQALPASGNLNSSTPANLNSSTPDNLNSSAPGNSSSQYRFDHGGRVSAPQRDPGAGGEHRPSGPEPAASPSPSPVEGQGQFDFMLGRPAAPAPLTTLLPEVHWDHDTRPAANVRPVPAGEESRLFYGNSDPFKAGHFAFINYYFTSPSVNIDHCDHVTVSRVEADSLTVVFHSREAFDHAAGSWSVEQGLVLIAHVQGCGDYERGERCYFSVLSLETHSSSGRGGVIVARGQSKHPDSLTSGWETEWGWWSPHGERAGASSARESAAAEPTFSWRPSADPTPGAGPSRTSGTGAAAATPARSGGGAPKNGSSARLTGRVPCVAPPDTKYGLPTACLGDLFDLDLDDGLGRDFMGDKARGFVDALAPEFDFEVPPRPSGLDFDKADPLWRKKQRRGLVVRRWTWASVWASHQQGV
ncbi:hypothetical protein CDD83_7463 [Cordyceps sp. RAO-2017]|nr:hypothetical protein CDD83_7463 [Cordyceps sp. RAO-2017]